MAVEMEAGTRAAQTRRSPAPGAFESEPYELPGNLTRFFSSRIAPVEATPSACCAPSEQESCCEAEAKPECCGAATEEGCGCR